MSGHDGIWRVVSLDDEAVQLEVLGRVSALSLAVGLVGSKAVVRRLFARGQLACEGTTLARQDMVEVGQRVRLAFHRTGAMPPSTADAPCVIYRDPVLLAADKPAGLLVHGDGSGEDTLTARVHAALHGQGCPAVPQAVQRLDVETTGVTLFSLTEEFQPSLDVQVAGHAMRKRYLAVVEGRLPAARSDQWLTLDGPIARDRHDARRMRVGSTGKASLTRVRILDERQGLSLLLVELGSGRRHQIRVHLSHEGHPLLGDDFYGGRRHNDGLMLHAWEERLTHPVTREPLCLRTAWPERFARLFPSTEPPCLE